MNRPYMTAARLRELEQRLSPRDHDIIRQVAELHFISGRQLQRLFFVGNDDPAVNARATRRALLRLVELQALDRLARPIGGVRAGSAGFVHYLSPAGKSLAMKYGWLPEQRRRRSIVPGSLFVRHALAVAELHTRLKEADRAKRFELLELAAEPTTWRSFVGLGGQRLVLKPDSFVRLATAEYEDTYYLEVDRGTEGSRALERQLRLYWSYHQAGHEQVTRGVFPRVLWLAPHADRVAAIIDAAAHLPAESWQLFQVVRFDEAIDVMAGDGENAVELTT